MNRRNFILTSSAAFVSTLLSNSLLEIIGSDSGKALAATTPDPAITAAVNIIVPPDPNIPGDFKGSDYGGDVVLVETLGAGETILVGQLNSYASRVTCNNAFFINLTPNQQLEAIKLWISERDQISAINRDLLSALLGVSMIGTFERNTPAQREVLFESMGWYDPADPGGTFRIPCEGYPDSFQFPVALKKGLK